MKFCGLAYCTYST